MASLQHYLDANAGPLTAVPELLPFFALPHVPNPESHPSFKELFAPSWDAETRRRLDQFLSTALRASTDRQPRLLMLAAAAKSPASKAAADLRLADALARYTALQAEYYDLVGLAAELVGMVESCLAGRPLISSQLEAVISRFARLTLYQSDIATHSLDARRSLADITMRSMSIAEQFGGLPRSSHPLTASISSVVASPHLNFQSAPLASASSYQYQLGSASSAHASSSPALPATAAAATSLSATTAAATHTDYYSSTSGAQSLSAVNLGFPESTLRPPPTQGSPPPAIDTTRLRTALLSSLARSASLVSVQNCAALLHALRRHLTLSTPGPHRLSIVSSFTDGDVLGCRESDPHARIVTAAFQALSPTDIRSEALARFLNILASICLGRSYLLNGTDTISSLHSFLSRSASPVSRPSSAAHPRGSSSNSRPATASTLPAHDSVAWQHALGALQKLSLRRRAQSHMISIGCLEWIVDLLAQADNLSDYCTEYAAALLMNLCLRTAGRRRCIPMRERVLRVMSALLEHDNTNVRTYVHGALYSVLAFKAIRDQALSMGLPDHIESLKPSSEPALASQLDFILQELRSEHSKPDPDADSDSEDPSHAADDTNINEGILADEEGDMLADEENEGVETLDMELVRTGERLLPTYFVLSQTQTALAAASTSIGHASSSASMSSTAKVQSTQLSSIVEHAHGSLPLQRPITPLHHSTTHVSATTAHSYSEPASIESPASSTQSAALTARLVSRPPPLPKKQLAGGETGVQEYISVFTERPKIPRTPNPGDQPSRTLITAEPPEQPPPLPASLTSISESNSAATTSHESHVHTSVTAATRARLQRKAASTGPSASDTSPSAKSPTHATSSVMTSATTGTTASYSAATSPVKKGTALATKESSDKRFVSQRSGGVTPEPHESINASTDAAEHSSRRIAGKVSSSQQSVQHSSSTSTTHTQRAQRIVHQHQHQHSDTLTSADGHTAPTAGDSLGHRRKMSDGSDNHGTDVDESKASMVTTVRQEGPSELIKRSMGSMPTATAGASHLSSHTEEEDADEVRRDKLAQMQSSIVSRGTFTVPQNSGSVEALAGKASSSTLVHTKRTTFVKSSQHQSMATSSSSSVSDNPAAALSETVSVVTETVVHPDGTRETTRQRVRRGPSGQEQVTVEHKRAEASGSSTTATKPRQLAVAAPALRTSADDDSMVSSTSSRHLTSRGRAVPSSRGSGSAQHLEAL
jgi:hypothetical protein